MLAKASRIETRCIPPGGHSQNLATLPVPRFSDQGLNLARKKQQKQKRSAARLLASPAADRG
jgi:hypothetical protein